MARSAPAASIAADEVARFSAQAADWWNMEGSFRSLHRLNPLRVGYVRDQIVAHCERDATRRDALRGLKLLDVGCGGGLLAEPLARLGATVTGLDASAETIAVAAAHAAESGLAIDYKASSVEELAEGKARYDVITALEIVEHVADRASFIAALAKLLKPDGLLLMATLNRTTRSFMLGVVAAEYVLGWVPRGTHDWNSFVRPSELARELEQEGLALRDLTGMVFNLLRGEFVLSKTDLRVNYLLSAVKTAS